ncbi:hypothetical protein GLOIN_2v1523180, partial [Rhizophagus irregularis DAOM 181602=DAOM 197198]
FALRSINIILWYFFFSRFALRSINIILWYSFNTLSQVLVVGIFVYHHVVDFNIVMIFLP